MMFGRKVDKNTTLRKLIAAFEEKTHTKNRATFPPYDFVFSKYLCFLYLAFYKSINKKPSLEKTHISIHIDQAKVKWIKIAEGIFSIIFIFI